MLVYGLIRGKVVNLEKSAVLTHGFSFVMVEGIVWFELFFVVAKRDHQALNMSVCKFSLAEFTKHQQQVSAPLKRRRKYNHFMSLLY